MGKSSTLTPQLKLTFVPSNCETGETLIQAQATFLLDICKTAYLSPTLAQVELDGGVGVDGVPLVRIDRHTEQTRVGLHRFTNYFFLVSKRNKKLGLIIMNSRKKESL
jgi:hypothetical protein